MPIKLHVRKRQIGELLLSVAIGCLSYFLLIHFADNLLVKHQDRLLSFQAFSIVVLLFVIVSLMINGVNAKLLTYYRSYLNDRRFLSTSLILSSLILLIANYLLFASAKYIAGMPEVLTLRRQGAIVIAVIWLVEMLMVRQYMLNHFYRELVRLYRQAKELEEKTAIANYKALQSQLNPHFLFNSLNTLVSEIEYNPKVAIAFTQNLASVYRYILNSQHRHTVPLGEELDFMEDYLMLHKVRIGDCIKVDNRIPETLRDINIPPLTLQLLVENIIKHNVITHTKPMVITLYTEQQDQQKWLCVKNLLQEKKSVPASGKGLENLNRRCLLLYKTGIAVVRNEKEFTVKIPFVYE